mgnify:CR=1 FL=1
MNKILVSAFAALAVSATAVAQGRSTADGKHYTSITDDGRAIVKYQYSNGQAVDTLLNLDTVKPEEGTEVKGLKIAGYELSQDEERLLVWSNRENIYRRSYKADYYYYVITAGGVKRDKFKRLTEGKVQAAQMAPDGRQVVFMRDNNLYLVKVMSAGIDLAERQITTDGERNKIINGVPDWVYEEEFSMDRAIAWSPDSKTVCYLKWDESPVNTYYLPLYQGAFPTRSEYELYPGQYTYKYPVAGETNSTISAWAYDVYTKKTTALKVPVDADGYIPRIQYTTQDNQLAVMTLNRLQNRLQLYFVNSQSGVAKLIVEDTNDQYIAEGDLDAVQFDPQGFTWASERSGYRHLYYYNNLGQQQRQLTKGNFDVTAIYGYDPATKCAYVQVAYLGQGAEMPAPLTRGIYKIDAKGQMLPLFNGGKDGKGCRGTHRASFSKGFIYMQHTYTDAETPAKTTLESVSNLKVLKTLVDNSDQKKPGMPKREFVQFTTERGDVLNGFIIRPANAGSEKLPAVLFQYSGPGSQQVLDTWNAGFEQTLVANGFVYGCFDGRGTGARGAQWERQTYCQLGVKESEDQLSAGRYVAKLPYVDANRVGIWGWSFGGYLSALSAFKSGKTFKMAISVAPVTNWRYYDNIYTERFLQTPQENPDGYDQNSPITFAKDLDTKYLLIHGTADDNVHFQNAMDLVTALNKAGKQYDQFFYPNKNHFIMGGNTRAHLYTKLTNYILENL